MWKRAGLHCLVAFLKPAWKLAMFVFNSCADQFQATAEPNSPTCSLIYTKHRACPQLWNTGYYLWFFLFHLWSRGTVWKVSKAETGSTFQPNNFNFKWCLRPNYNLTSALTPNYKRRNRLGLNTHFICNGQFGNYGVNVAACEFV